MLVVIAIATWVVAMVRRSQRGPATWAALGIPAQAVLGGLTVLTHLNPWLVAAHFMLSMADHRRDVPALVAVARRRRDVPDLPGPIVRILARITAARHPG